ncbi:hypothetical protein Tco_1102651 [Tanacetum coccineum]
MTVTDVRGWCYLASAGTCRFQCYREAGQPYAAQTCSGMLFVQIVEARQDPTSKSLILLSLLSRKETTKPKGDVLRCLSVRDASLFVITALKMFLGIRKDGALSIALCLFACDKERVN